MMLNEPPDAGDGEDLGELGHAAQVRGGLGRLLMIEESMSTYSCGAHGNVDASASLVDVASGATVPETFGAEVAARLRPAALAQFRDNEMLDGADELHYAETVPWWRDGQLRCATRCGSTLLCLRRRRVWASYTAGAWVGTTGCRRCSRPRRRCRRRWRACCRSWRAPTAHRQTG
jgi:hypothetical protein